MMNIRNFDEARTALQRYYNVNAGKTRYTLDRMRELLTFLDNPQNDLKMVHVAGTSGKTSTVYYVSALLEQSGASIGLTVSPHVNELNERLQINHVPLPEAEFCAALGRFIDKVEQSGVRPSYFELMVAFAFWEFKRRNVDYAVVEVGLGGLLDGTNVISRPDKVCIITDIGFDHTHILGNTLAEIAAQKAGIIQPENHVFARAQQQDVLAEIQQRCDERSATLHVLEDVGADENDGYDLPLFQQRNFQLAAETARYVLQRDGRKQLTNVQLKFAAKVYIPGRMETLRIADKTVILDGAHNGQKMSAFIASLRQRYPGKQFAAVVAVVEAPDMRWRGALDALVPEMNQIIVTAFDFPVDDMPKQSVHSEIIADYIRTLTDKEIIVENNLTAALQTLLKCPQPVLAVTGSLYFLGMAKKQLEQLAA